MKAKVTPRLAIDERIERLRSLIEISSECLSDRCHATVEAARRRILELSGANA